MRSYSGRDSAISQRLGWWAEQFGSTPVGEIDDDHIYDLIDHLKSQGSRFYCGKDFVGRAIFKAKGKKLAPATINRYVAATSSLFGFTSKMRLTPKNWVHPCRDIGREREDNEVERYLSKDERSALLLAARKSSWDKLYLLVLMALVTGARKGNLLSLRWGDVDLEAGVARLRSTKNGDRRVLPLTPGVVQELKKFSGKTSIQLIFESSKVPGQPRDPSSAFARALKEAKVRNFRFHDLHHTCGTYLARSGASTLQVAEGFRS
jgi:integrase